jgi:hypothetical protein
MSSYELSDYWWRSATIGSTRNESRLLAPNAVRIPISCVRCSTLYDITP